nr:unnamed protein product [Callosobruchus analis]
MLVIRFKADSHYSYIWQVRKYLHIWQLHQASNFNDKYCAPTAPVLANTPIVVYLASTAVSSPLGLSRVSISVYLVSIMDSRVVAAASFVVL